MTKEGKKKGLRCECGGLFEAKIEKFGKVIAEVMKCAKCRHITLTLEQVKYYARMKLLHTRFAKDRKIVKMGNSLGFTLPKGFASIGQRVKITPKDERHLILVIQ